MSQTTLHERAVAVTRRLSWGVLALSLVVVGGNLWIGAFRTPAPTSLLERYGGAGMGFVLASYAAITLLPPKHKARWALWSICAAGSLVAIANFWLKATT